MSSQPTSSSPGIVPINTTTSTNSEPSPSQYSPTLSSPPWSPRPTCEESPNIYLGEFVTSSSSLFSGSYPPRNTPSSPTPKPTNFGTRRSLPPGYAEAIRGEMSRQPIGYSLFPASHGMPAGPSSSAPNQSLSRSNSRKKFKSCGRHSNDWLFGGFSVREYFGVRRHEE